MTAPENELTHTSRNFSVLLSPTPRRARLARLLARDQLRSCRIPLDPAEHIVAELANNAATHGRVAGRDFRLTLQVVADTVRFEVTDTRADRLPQRTPTAPDAESGRGLLLVEKTVWAEVRSGTALARPSCPPAGRPGRR